MIEIWALLVLCLTANLPAKADTEITAEAADSGSRIYFGMNFTGGIVDKFVTQISTAHTRLRTIAAEAGKIISNASFKAVGVVAGCAKDAMESAQHAETVAKQLAKFNMKKLVHATYLAKEAFRHTANLAIKTAHDFMVKAGKLLDAAKRDFQTGEAAFLAATDDIKKTTIRTAADGYRETLRSAANVAKQAEESFTTVLGYVKSIAAFLHLNIDLTGKSSEKSTKDSATKSKT